jgi:O-antigen/teichoic acid export membrane protein
MKSVVQVFSFDILSKVLLGVTGIILIRFMPEIEYARYTLALSLVSVVTQTLVSSFKRIYIVGYQRFKLENSPSLFLGLQLWGICLLVLMTLPFKDFAEGVYWFVVAAIIATCLSEFAKTVVQQQLKFLQFSIIEMARTLVFVLSLLCLIYFIRYELKAWQVLLVQAMAMFLVFSTVFSKYLDLKSLFKMGESVRFALELVKGEYKYVFGYFFVFAFFSQVDVFVLKALAGSVELATYGSAFRYYSLLLLALGAVHAVLLPVIQRIQSIDELESILAQHKRMLLVFVPLVLLGAWLSKWVIPWLDMGKYPNAAIVFQILAISAIVSFAFSPHSNLVMRFEDFRFLFISICMGLLVNVGLCVWLVPILGATGPAIATLITFGSVNVSIFLRSRKHRKSLASLQQGDS